MPRPFGRRLRTLLPQVSPTDRSVGFSRGPSERWLQPTPVQGFDSSSPAAPHGTSDRRIVGLRTRRAPLADATFTHDCYIRRSSPRSPRRPAALSGRYVWGEGLLWVRAAYRFLQTRQGRTGTSTRVVSAPAFDHVPLAEPMIAWRLPSACPRGARRRQRAAEARPEADSPRVAGVLRRQPRCSHGPADLERRARSLLGVLRTCLLLSRPSIPLSPSRCPRSLECSGRASRGPSRPVSRGERGRARHHVPAKSCIPRSPREGYRLPASLGCFPPIVPAQRPRVAPLPARIGLYVTPPRRGIATVRPAPFRPLPSASP